MSYKPQKLLEDVDEIKSDLIRVIEAITHIPAENIREHKIDYLNLLKRLYEINLGGNVLSSFRKAVCSVDLKLYKIG